MIVESAQLLSTAHRVLDGIVEIHERLNGGKKYWKHPILSYEESIYKASHIKHPDAIWVRESGEQYMYLYKLFESLAIEYTHRYKKPHATYEKLYRFLSVPPRTIWNVKGFTEPPQCMPESCKDSTAIQGYRNYYIEHKIDFIRYTNRKAPDWLKEHLDFYHQTSGVQYEK